MRSVFCLHMAFRQVLLSIQSLMLSKREDRWCDKSCNGAGRFFARSQGEQGRVLADSLWDQQGVTFLCYFDLFLNHFHPFLSFIPLYVLVQLSTCQGSLVFLSVVFLLSLPVLLFFACDRAMLLVMLCTVLCQGTSHTLLMLCSALLQGTSNTLLMLRTALLQETSNKLLMLRSVLLGETVHTRLMLRAALFPGTSDTLLMLRSALL